MTARDQIRAMLDQLMGSDNGMFVFFRQCLRTHFFFISSTWELLSRSTRELYNQTFFFNWNYQ